MLSLYLLYEKDYNLDFDITLEEYERMKDEICSLSYENRRLRNILVLPNSEKTGALVFRE